MDSKYFYRFTEQAIHDFEEILHYISADLENPIAAKNLQRKIFERIDLIRVFPDSGSSVNNEFLSDKNVRKILVGNYIIYFKVHHDEEMITIVRIVYGKRNLDEIFKLM